MRSHDQLMDGRLVMLCRLDTVCCWRLRWCFPSVSAARRRRTPRRTRPAATTLCFKRQQIEGKKNTLGVFIVRCFQFVCHILCFLLFVFVLPVSLEVFPALWYHCCFTTTFTLFSSTATPFLCSAHSLGFGLPSSLSGDHWLRPSPIMTTC